MFQKDTNFGTTCETDKPNKTKILKDISEDSRPQAEQHILTVVGVSHQWR